MLRRAWILGLAIVLFLLAAGVHGIFHWTDARPLPSIAAIPWLLALFAAGASIASAVTLARRVRGVPRRLGMVALHLLVLFGGAVGTLTSDPTFPFGLSHEMTLPLPDGHGRAYLYRDGILCSRTLWLAPPGSWRSYQQPGNYSCTQEARLAWDATSKQVRVVDPNGAPLPPPEPLQFYLGPH